MAKACVFLAMLLACTRRAPREAVDAEAARLDAEAARLDAEAARLEAEAAHGPRASVGGHAGPGSSSIDDAGASLDASGREEVGAGEADALAPFGPARVSERAGCAALKGAVSERDVTTSFVDGDDLLALVNRAPTGQLAPDWAPSDLVDLRTTKPASATDCKQTQCLRRDAASALGELLAQMKHAGFVGEVRSAFRSYGAQCGTFTKWASKSNACKAAEQSALPGHSQHQLGTTVDLFTEAWAKDERGPFRNGFGCTEAGRWLREHASAFGFVMPYPIHPDDRHPKQSCVTRWDIPVDINPKTGYRYEHWHFRFIGKDAATRFEAARVASDLGTPNELTLEQWLRRQRGISGADAELPMCDGCNCGACSTLAPLGEHPCDRQGGALHLDANGRPIAAPEAPSITRVLPGKARAWKGRVVDVSLEVPRGAITQPPIVGPSGAGYAPGASYERLAPYPETAPRAFAPLRDAFVIAIEPVPNGTGSAWPYRAAITAEVHGRIYNRANVRLPARPGTVTVHVPIPGDVHAMRVVLLRGGVPASPEHVVHLD